MDQKTQSGRIADFLRTNNVFNITALEQILDLPHSTIACAIQYKRYIPKKHIPNIEALLSRYGFSKN